MEPECGSGKQGKTADSRGAPEDHGRHPALWRGDELWLG